LNSVASAQFFTPNLGFWPSSEVFTGKVAYFSGLIYYLITTIFETTQTTAIEATTFRCSGFICKGNPGLFSNHQRQQLSQP